MKLFKLKPIINKKNGQVNFSLPKKKVGKEVIDIIKNNPHAKVKIKFEGMDI